MKNLINRIAKKILSVNPLLEGQDLQNGLGLLSRDKVPSHTILSRFKKESLEVVEVEKERKVLIFKQNGQDDGYHPYSNSWWYNLNCPLAYSYIDIDSLYPSQYFSHQSTGHPDKEFAKDIYSYMQKTYKELFGREFSSVLELGTGGGEITYQFHAHGIDFLAVEGTEEGCRHLQNLGIAPSNILKSDLKRLPFLNRKFDLVMCTEVVEHIEPFFAGRVIESCTMHADAVWFSGADRNRPAHYHHINEIGIEAWDNLFAFLGHNQHVVLNKLHHRADRLYLRNFPR